MTTLSRALAYGLGVLLLAGLVILALAGVSAATALVVTAVAVFVMIALGGLVGGRRNGPKDGDPGGTMGT